jgi:hypothetical protein
VTFDQKQGSQDKHQRFPLQKTTSKNKKKNAKKFPAPTSIDDFMGEDDMGQNGLRRNGGGDASSNLSSLENSKINSRKKGSEPFNKIGEFEATDDNHLMSKELHTLEKKKTRKTPKISMNEADDAYIMMSESLSKDEELIKEEERVRRKQNAKEK